MALLDSFFDPSQLGSGASLPPWLTALMGGGPPLQMPSSSGAPAPSTESTPQLPALPQQPQPQPQQPQQEAPSGPGIMDRLTAGATNLMTGGNPIAGLFNSVNGLMTGQRTDATGIMQNQTRAVSLALMQKGVPPSLALAAPFSPDLLKAVVSNAFEEPKWSQIGQTMLGQPQYGFVNARDQTVRPMTAPGAPGAIDDSRPLYDQLPKASQAIVDNMLAGHQPMPSSMALKSPMWTQLVAAANEKATANGSFFDASSWGQRNKTAQDFSSGGRSGQTINALDTVQQHLEKLSNDSEVLDNGDWPSINATKNWLATNTSLDPARRKQVQAISDDVKAVTDEMARAYKSGAMSDHEIAQWQSLISTSDSKEKMRQALSDFADLLNGKRRTTLDQYRGIMGTDAPAANNQENVRITKLLHDRNTGVTSAAPAVAGPPQAAVQFLQQNPNLAAQFDAKYGPGASARVLGR